MANVWDSTLVSSTQPTQAIAWTNVLTAPPLPALSFLASLIQLKWDRPIAGTQAPNSGGWSYYHRKPPSEGKSGEHQTGDRPGS